jgi:tRNA(fMet)-specific endonuclease VapC
VTLYLLDTNAASDVIRGQPPQVRERLVSLPLHRAHISAVTQGELSYGLAKRGNPAALTALVNEFLIRVEVLPWTAEVAVVYGALRARCAARGVTLGALDMMIAAQAVQARAILVTRDRTFTLLADEVQIEDWSTIGQR